MMKIFRVQAYLLYGVRQGYGYNEMIDAKGKARYSIAEWSIPTLKSSQRESI